MCKKCGRSRWHKAGRQRQQRKFSLGSFFGYRGGSKPAANCNEVVLDMGSDYSWSDTNSTSSSSDSESIPRTPMFEEFIDHSYRRGRISSSSHSSVSPIRGSGGDWEVMMLADELEKREREREREEARKHHYPTTLRDLEEESDTLQREDSPDEYSNMEDSNSSSTTHLLSQSISDPSQRSLETSFTEASRSVRETRQQRGGSLVEQSAASSSLRQSRGLILRAASLDRERAPAPPAPRRAASLRSAAPHTHKRL